MKLSIVVPVYNVEKYLEECVASVLALNIDFELILVDDGSTDRSGVFCDTLAQKDHRIKVIHQRNGGLSVARNTGIQNSAGDYIMFLDSDDFIDARETECMLQGICQSPDVLMGLYRNYYTDGNIYQNESCDGFLKVKGLLSIDDFLSAVPADGSSCYMIACRFVVKRSLFLKNDLLFFPGIYHEDEEWTSRLFSSAETVFVSHRYFYQYRQSRDGAITSAVTPKHIWDIFTIMEHLNDLCSLFPSDSVKGIYFRNRMAQLYLNNMIHLFVLKKENRNVALDKLKYYQKICSPFLSGKIGSITGFFLKVIGVRGTCILLSIARRIRKGMA